MDAVSLSCYPSGTMIGTIFFLMDIDIAAVVGIAFQAPLH